MDPWHSRGSSRSSRSPTAATPTRCPTDNDVTAGWTALLVFVGLIIAVVVLGVSLAKQLRKAKAARDAGVYGDPPAAVHRRGRRQS